jgi:hypothetical protein
MSAAVLDSVVVPREVVSGVGPEVVSGALPEVVSEAVPREGVSRLAAVQEVVLLGCLVGQGGEASLASGAAEEVALPLANPVVGAHLALAAQVFLPVGEE